MMGEHVNAIEGQVRLVNITSQYADVRGEMSCLFESVLDTGHFVGGTILESFERDLARYAGVSHAIGCSDGTMALVIGLLAAGMKKSDATGVPTNSYIATVNAVVHAGGMSIFIDCDAQTYLRILTNLRMS